ncbi:MAG: aryl-sulfate sulfotransferase [Burkholderiaceae bacterium]
MAPEFSVIHATPGSHQGLVVLTVGRNTRAIHSNSEFEAIIALNASGEIVWTKMMDFALMDCRQSRRGSLLVMGTTGVAEELAFDGTLVNRWYCPDRFPEGTTGTPLPTMKIHHAISELSDGLLATVSIREHPLENPEPDWQRFMSDTIVLFNREGTIHMELDLIDLLDTARITTDGRLPYWRFQGWSETMDWSHANSIIEDPADGGLLLSLRHQDAIIKVSRSGELVWILGNPLDWGGQWQDRLLKIDGGPPFFHQHDVSITSYGELMLFDNGANPDQPIDTHQSSVLCFRIDEAAMTATETWRFGSDFLPYSTYVSGVCELDNKNVFVACTGLKHDSNGRRVKLPPKGVGAIEVFEVARTGPNTGTCVFHARLEDKNALPDAGWHGFRPEFLDTQTAARLLSA